MGLIDLCLCRILFPDDGSHRQRSARTRKRMFGETTTNLWIC
jgi:hypothetical protein